jgi:hypothetical protein
MQRLLPGVLGACVIFAALVTACLILLRSPSAPEVAPAEDSRFAGTSSEDARPEPTSSDDFPPLEETSPPPGLPIVPWGKRNHFPVIRKPQYVSAAQGDRLLALDEPVLGLVLGGEARAYSTNQLNDHEMVVDTLAGTPVLVTY